MVRKLFLSTLIATSLLTTYVNANNLHEYDLLSNQAGLGIYKKDNDYGYSLGEIYVQRINMKHVDVKLMSGSKSGEYFSKGSLSSFWNVLNGNYDALSVSNGAFFETLSGSSTKLSFPWKANGVVMTMGASNGFSNDRKMLVFKDSCASGYKCALIMNYSDYLFNSNSYSNILVGLDPNVDKSKEYPIGRTFVGVDPSNSSNPIMYIVHGTQATQEEMRDIMYDLDLDDNTMVMFDGSGSSQLAFGNTEVYGSAGIKVDKRPLPQVIVVTKK